MCTCMCYLIQGGKGNLSLIRSEEAWEADLQMCEERSAKRGDTSAKSWSRKHAWPV